MPSDAMLSRLVDYVRQIGRDRKVEYYVATKHGTGSYTTKVQGELINYETQESLLNGLVDFSDYFSFVRDAVEKRALADSDHLPIKVGQVR
jgi:hypothetical protein